MVNFIKHFRVFFFILKIIGLFKVRNFKNLFIGLASILFILFNAPANSYADYANLKKCGESPAFQKRLNNSVKKLEGRLKKYDPDSPAAAALQDQITRTKQRFDRYGKSQLLCGTDGLPHLIADGNFVHAAEFTVPGVMFLYIAGWIGWVGRKYLRTIKEQLKNPSEREIIIDVPLALGIMSSGFMWPVSAWKEYTSDDFVAKKEDVTVSPR